MGTSVELPLKDPYIWEINMILWNDETYLHMKSRVKENQVVSPRRRNLVNEAEATSIIDHL